MTDEEVRRLEAWKLEHDFLKHLTTLSTGSIVLTVGLLEKLFTSPEWKALVAVSVVAFAVSILSAILVKVQIISQIYGAMPPTDSKGISWFVMIPTMTAFVAFAVGVLSLVIFGVINIL